MATERQAFLQDVQQRIAELIRSSPAADLERNLKAMLAQTFQRMELVTHPVPTLPVRLGREGQEVVGIHFSESTLLLDFYRQCDTMVH